MFFVAGIDDVDNELLILETIHRYVETLDQYFENVRSPPLPPTIDAPAGV